MCAPPTRGDRSDPHLNVLRIQAVWSHHRLRRHNQLLNYLLHRQLRMVSLISKAAPHAATLARGRRRPGPMLAAVLRELGQGAATSCRIARLMAPFVARSGMIIAVRPSGWLRHFCWSYLECQRWLEGWPPRWPGVASAAAPQLSDQSTDGLEAAYNGGVPSSA